MGQWAVETIGPELPEGNAPNRLYLAVEDATGRMATVNHPVGWNQWRIPFSDLTGVDMSRVEMMTIGVGSRTNPTSGGVGIIYVDDISYGKPASTQ